MQDELLLEFVPLREALQQRHLMTIVELQDLKAQLTDVLALFLTAWAEARGDAREGHSSVEERLAVMCVIRNRVKSGRFGGASYRSVCLEPNQFSCWNYGTDPNHLALVSLAQSALAGVVREPLAVETEYLALGVIGEEVLDRTGGATHYYSPASMVPADRVPRWAMGKTPTADIGRQKFFLLA